MDNSLCEKEFLRIGLSFWTGSRVPGLGTEQVSTLDPHTAASVGDLEHIEKLETDLDTENHAAWTPLMYAAYHGHGGLVTHLMSRKCDPLKTNNKGRSPLILSAMCGNREVLSIILNKSTQSKSQLISATDHRNMTALSHAVRWGQLQVAEDLLEAGSSPDMTEHTRGLSLLMMAGEEGNRAMVELLLSWGADTRYETALGDTAVSVARARGHDTVARIITKHAAIPGTEPLSALTAPAKVKMMLEQRKLSASQDPSTLSHLLGNLGLEKYQHIFQEHEIDLPLLLTMTDEELREVGITKLGPRRKLTAAIGRIKERGKL